MVGGLFVRRAKDWVVSGRSLSQDSPEILQGREKIKTDVIQINSRLAALDVRALSLLRHKIPDLIIPLACVVDFYGLVFEVQSPAHLDLNSLVYGSDTDGLLYQDDDENGEKVAFQIQKYLNLKAFKIKERATGIVKEVILPIGVQIHRCGHEYYLINAHKLIASEEPLVHKSNTKKLPYELVEHMALLETMRRQLRPEHTISYNYKHTLEGLVYYKW